MSPPLGLVTCKCRIWQPLWKQSGLPAPGPLDQKSLGLKEQCHLLPPALAWGLRVLRRSLGLWLLRVQYSAFPDTQLFGLLILLAQR